MRKVGKMIVIALIAMLILMMNANVFATEDSTIAGSVITTMKNADTNSVKSNQIATAGARIVKALQAIGVVAAVIVLVVLGIKYIMGSAEEKAEYKKTFIPYIIGAFLIGGASAFAGMIFELIGTF